MEKRRFKNLLFFSDQCILFLLTTFSLDSVYSFFVDFILVLISTGSLSPFSSNQTVPSGLRIAKAGFRPMRDVSHTEVNIGMEKINQSFERSKINEIELPRRTRMFYVYVQSTINGQCWFS